MKHRDNYHSFKTAEAVTTKAETPICARGYMYKYGLHSCEGEILHDQDQFNTTLFMVSGYVSYRKLALIDEVVDAS